jgi:4,5-dihydroxyphthalate decarboxylase
MPLELTVRCGPNPRLQPLMDGEVKVEDVDLKFETRDYGRLFYDNLRNDAFEMSEMSISESMLARERREKMGKDGWDWVAIPIYLSRGHGWTRLMVRESSDIKSLADLKGKRVGVPDYSMTFALWMKALLKDLYGIEAKDISWYNMRPRNYSHGLELGLDDDPPPGVDVHWLTADDRPAKMLQDGDLDAAIGVPAEDFAAATGLRLLLPDEGKSVISQHYQRSGCFHANHHFLVQKRIMDANPGLGRKLYEAFKRSKEIAIERSQRDERDPTTHLYFENSDVQEQASVFGPEPYPVGLKNMRRTLGRLVPASLEQGLLRRRLELSEVYDPSTLDT